MARRFAWVRRHGRGECSRSNLAGATRGLPVIAVSAGGRSAQREALEAGADYFLEKPMRLSQVLETMRQVLEGQPGLAATP